MAKYNFFLILFQKMFLPLILQALVTSTISLAATIPETTTTEVQKYV